MSERRPGISQEEFAWDEKGRLLMPLGREQITLNVRPRPGADGETPQLIAYIDLPFLQALAIDGEVGILPGERRLEYELRVYGRLLTSLEVALGLSIIERIKRLELGLIENDEGEKRLLAARQNLEKKLKERAER